MNWNEEKVKIWEEKEELMEGLKSYYLKPKLIKIISCDTMISSLAVLKLIYMSLVLDSNHGTSTFFLAKENIFLDYGQGNGSGL